MCEFCTKHGEGEKWYLQAKNYSADFNSDLKRRKFAIDFFRKTTEKAPRDLKRLEWLSSFPRIIQDMVKGLVTWKQKKEHFGQVVPLEDVEKILSMVNTVVAFPCLCRKVTIKKEVRCCFGLSISPAVDSVISSILSDSYLNGPEVQGIEKVDKETALKMMKEFETDGLAHSVWTILTPFIAGICNCDRSDCLAMKVTVSHDLKVMFRAEYIAGIDWEQCTGCRECMGLCQFGALSYSYSLGKVAIDLSKCYGCGVCRAGCTKGAIFLKPRNNHPQVAQVW
ncbi:MAG TPA: 4Fe-4S binding protein [Thermodesulfobacteriota bacterium]|nr:4Fe-4S binding protein [Thermodesulfobacteriota bacterium]